MLYYNLKPGSTPEEKISGQLIQKHYRDPFNGERAPISGSANEEFMRREAQLIRKGLEVYDHEQGHPYVMTEKTQAAIEFFGLADDTHTPHEELLAGFRETLADADDEDELPCCFEPELVAC